MDWEKYDGRISEIMGDIGNKAAVEESITIYADCAAEFGNKLAEVIVGCPKLMIPSVVAALDVSRETILSVLPEDKRKAASELAVSAMEHIQAAAMLGKQYKS